MLDGLAFFDLNPIHIGMVLLIALLLFGPQKLPDIGKQIGNALRELKKAGGDVMNSFHTDHEPDNRSYNYDYNYPTEAENSAYRTSALTEAPPDLSDYTIAGMPVHEKTVEPDLADYAIAGSAEKRTSSTSDAQPHKEGTSNV